MEILVALLALMTFSGLVYTLFGPVAEPTKSYQKFGWGFVSPLLFVVLVGSTVIKMIQHEWQKSHPTQIQIG